MISMILGCILILYSKLLHLAYTDVLSHFYCSICKYLNQSFSSTNSPNSFISKFLLYLNLQHGDIESNPRPGKTKVKKVFWLSLECQ